MPPDTARRRGAREKREAFLLSFFFFNGHHPGRPLPEIKEIFMAKPGLALSLLWSTS